MAPTDLVDAENGAVHAQHPSEGGDTVMGDSQVKDKALIVHTAGHHGQHHGHHHSLDFKGRTTSGVQFKHRYVVKILGRIGWVAKGIIYSILGGLCCKMGAKGNAIETSPQGVFVLLGSGKSGKVLLVIEMAALVMYIIWRWWEGITQQGAHVEYGKAKNFFSFRLSPLVSGIVYFGYFIYCITLLPKVFKGEGQDAVQSDFTRKLQESWYGRALLVILGLAFTAAFITQVEGALTRKFHREMKPGLNKYIWWTTVVTGHIGIAGRAGFFLLIAILFYRSISDRDLGTADATFFSNALQSLRGETWGRVILFLIGFGMIVYGLYALQVSFLARIFPTPGPTTDEVRVLRAKRVEAAAKKERKALRKADKNRECGDVENFTGNSQEQPVSIEYDENNLERSTESPLEVSAGMQASPITGKQTV